MPWLSSPRPATPNTLAGFDHPGLCALLLCSAANMRLSKPPQNKYTPLLSVVFKTLKMKMSVSREEQLFKVKRFSTPPPVVGECESAALKQLNSKPLKLLFRLSSSVLGMRVIEALSVSLSLSLSLSLLTLSCCMLLLWGPASLYIVHVWGSSSDLLSLPVLYRLSGPGLKYRSGEKKSVCCAVPCPCAGFLPRGRRTSGGSRVGLFWWTGLCGGGGRGPEAAECEFVTNFQMLTGNENRVVQNRNGALFLNI